MKQLPTITKTAITEDGVDKVQFSFTVCPDTPMSIPDFVAALDGCAKAWFLATILGGRIYSHLLNGQTVTLRHEHRRTELVDTKDYRAMQAVLASDESGSIEINTTGVVITSPEERNSGIILVTAGRDDWQPTDEDLSNITTLFLEACDDPRGAVITTIAGVDARFIHPNESKQA